MDYGLRGRVAVVNAASKGIGRAIAEALAAEGVRLVISSRDRAALDRTAAEIAAAYGQEVVPVAADVAQAGTAERVVGEAITRFGRLDILVNNSGGPPSGTFADLDDAAWQFAFDLLLLSAVRMVRAAVPHLRASGHGCIVNVESFSVKQPIPGLILSNSLRAGVVGMAKTLADELAPLGITVNTVCPGRIMTDRTRAAHRDRAQREGVPVDDIVQAVHRSEIPLGYVGAASEMGNAVAFLCSDAASYITGVALPVDGGLLRGIF
jgi:3-oxoacyl-[acyl-carrier protein] reductase